jgi:hypothetical protein
VTKIRFALAAAMIVCAVGGVATGTGAQASVAGQTAATALARSPAPRDFAGRWVLVVAESDFGSSGPPRAIRLEVRQSAEQLQVVSHLVNDAGERTSTSTYAVDGSESRNVNGDVKMVSRLAWRGDSCVVESRTRRMGMTVKVTDRWSLSADASRLRIDRNMSALFRSRHMTMVFARDTTDR